MRALPFCVQIVPILVTTGACGMPSRSASAVAIDLGDMVPSLVDAAVSSCSDGDSCDAPSITLFGDSATEACDDAYRQFAESSPVDVVESHGGDAKLSAFCDLSAWELFGMCDGSGESQKDQVANDGASNDATVGLPYPDVSSDVPDQLSSKALLCGAASECQKWDLEAVGCVAVVDISLVGCCDPLKPTCPKVGVCASSLCPFKAGQSWSKCVSVCICQDCATDADCFDFDKCTTDKCDVGKCGSCYHELLPNCVP